MRLSKNHQRTLRSSLLFVEKKIDELIWICDSSSKNSFRKIEFDLNQEKVADILRLASDIKLYIASLKEKYELKQTAVPVSRVLNTTVSQIWEVLSDTNSKFMIKFGRFNEDEDFSELDQDIHHLLSLTEHIEKK